LKDKPEHQDGHKNHRTNQDCVHSFSNSSTGNGLLTLAEVEGRKLKGTKGGTAKSKKRGTPKQKGRSMLRPYKKI